MTNKKIKSTIIATTYIVVIIAATIVGFILGILESTLEDRKLDNMTESNYEIVIYEDAKMGEYDMQINTYSMHVTQDPKTKDLIIKSDDLIF